MALALPYGFEQDIQSRDTALFPYVLIYTGTEYLRISTNAYSHPDTGNGLTFNTLPILLNIPSLKESIDIQNRKYKISSINLDISNFPYKGKRFSELIGDTSLINRACSVFWVSPSTNMQVSFDQGYSVDDYPKAFFQVYYGTIRRYTHDTEKVRLVVEDRSQSILHKDLPLPNEYDSNDNIIGRQRWLGTDETIPDKYKNKPIPMVYGHVDRSPLLFADNHRSLIADSVAIGFVPLEDDGFGGTNSALWMDVSDSLISVRSDQFQYSNSDAKIMLDVFTGTANTGDDLPEDEYQFISLVCHDSTKNYRVTLNNPRDNPLGDTEDYDHPEGSVSRISDGLQNLNDISWRGQRTSELIAFDADADFYKRDDIVLLYDSDDGYLSIDFRSIWKIGDGTHNSEFLLLKLYFDYLPDYDFETIYLIGMKVNSLNWSNITPQGQGGNLPQWGYVIHTNSVDEYDGGAQLGLDDISGVSNDGNYYALYHNLNELQEAQPDEYSNVNPIFNFKNSIWDPNEDDWGGDGNNPNAAIDFYTYRNYGDSHTSFTVYLELDGNLNEIDLLREVRATKIFDKNFYANVKGRSDTEATQWFIQDFAQLEDAVEVKFDGIKLYTDYDDYGGGSGDAPNTQLTSPLGENNSHTQSNLDKNIGIALDTRLSAHQGWTTDGTYIYLFDGQIWKGREQVKIEKWKKDFSEKVAFCGNLVPDEDDSEWGDPTASGDWGMNYSVDHTFGNNNHPILKGSPKGVNHIGSGDYYEGRIFAMSQEWRGGGAIAQNNIPKPQLKVLDAIDMYLIGTANMHGVKSGLLNDNDPWGYGANEQGVNDHVDSNTSGYGHGHDLCCDGSRGIIFCSVRNNVNTIDGYNYAMYDLNSLMGDTIPVRAPWIGLLRCYHNLLGFEETWDPEIFGLVPDYGDPYTTAVLPGSTQYAQGITTYGDYLYQITNLTEIYVWYIDYVPGATEGKAIFMAKHDLGNNDAAEEGLDFISGTFEDVDGISHTEDLWIGTLRDWGNSYTGGSVSQFYLWPVNSTTIGGGNIYDVGYTTDGGLIEKPSDIAYHLMREELGAGDVNGVGLQTSRNEHSGWSFGFSIDKKVSSKKLLEDIMSSSKSFLRYNSSGEYDFVTIRNFLPGYYDIKIINDEIISFKYDRTKVEDVYTSIGVEYHKDYARDEYSQSLPPINTDQLITSTEYSTDYYGLKADHTESEKIFSSDYIRNKGTARLWQEFLLNWHCNQHILIFLDLPLKYMNCEVGDIVAFDKETDVLPYGVRYASNGIYVNGQVVFPQFMVYETNKGVDKVSIKCIQMHKIDHTISPSTPEDKIEFNLADTILSNNIDDTNQIVESLLKR